MKGFVILFFCFCTLFPLTIASQDAAQKPCPCCTEDHRAFDFWLGDWNTYLPNGNLAGTNHIVLLQDSCIMQENWTSAKGKYTGTSYNWYDAASKTWHQTWVDNQGGSLQLKGNKKGNQMVLSSDPLPDGKGGNSINRITWTDLGDGSVRQLWEVSQDGGSTWNVAFNGHYKPKEK